MLDILLHTASDSGFDSAELWIEAGNHRMRSIAVPKVTKVEICGEQIRMEISIKDQRIERARDVADTANMLRRRLAEFGF